MEDRYLTPEEVAERINVKPATVRGWLRDGTLKGAKFGRVWRVRESELQRFIREAEKGGLDDETD